MATVWEKAVHLVYRMLLLHFDVGSDRMSSWSMRIFYLFAKKQRLTHT